MARFNMMEQVLTAVKVINNPRGATLAEIIKFIRDRLDGLLSSRISITGDVRSAVGRSVEKGLLKRRGRGRYNMRAGAGRRSSRYARSKLRRTRRQRATKQAPKRRRAATTATAEKEAPVAKKTPSEKRVRFARPPGSKQQEQHDSPSQTQPPQGPAQTKSEHRLLPPPRTPTPEAPSPTPDNEVRPGADDEDADDVNRQPYVYRDPQETQNCDKDDDEQRSLDEDIENIYK